ncbi:MAG TPA: hypothetical protein DDZ78_01935, partial [Porphyromonadaceae bacterium]|nr:hypothetical protein [Porphyromonadaceae bacterium]
VYGLNKQLPNNNYTNVSPDEYYQSPELGSATFTGKNAVYRKEAYYTSAYTVDTMLIYEIGVKLPLELGEKFLTEYKKTGHGSFSDADSFRKFFPGVYVTTGFGSSTILNVSLSSLYVHYKYNDPKGSSQKTDTIRSTALQLNITPEVAQVNTVENNNEQLLAPGSAHSYIKSPAGVYTKLKFPFSDIHSRLGEGQSINLAALTLYADPEVYEDAAVKLSPPSYLLLIHKDSLQGFFEEGKMPDNRTGFLSAAFNATTYSYSFNNISALVNYYNEQNNYKAFDLEYYLIPVDVTTQTNSRTGQVEVTSVSNQMMPTAVRLDKQPENMKLEMIFSKF